MLLWVCSVDMPFAVEPFAKLLNGFSRWLSFLLDTSFPRISVAFVFAGACLVVEAFLLLTDADDESSSLTGSPSRSSLMLCFLAMNPLNMPLYSVSLANERHEAALDDLDVVTWL